MPRRIFQLARGGKNLVHPGSVLYPLQVDKPPSIVLRGVRANFEVFVGDEVSVSGPAAAASPQGFGLDGRVIVSSSSGGQKRAYTVRQPQRGENLGEG